MWLEIIMYPAVFLSGFACGMFCALTVMTKRYNELSRRSAELSKRVDVFVSGGDPTEGKD